MKDMKKYICILLFLTGIASCDVLELTPLDKISETDTWTDQALIQTYVNGSYNAIQHGYVTAMISVASDEAYSIFNNAGFYFVQSGTLTSDNVSSMNSRLNQWEFAYGYLKTINTFFEKIEMAPVDDDFKSTAIGEMKFIRAYVYANLIWTYGGVPIITKVFQLNEDYAVTRNSYDECVDFIVTELDDAVSQLPARQPDTQKGRASGDACRALKARVLLYAASALNNPASDRAKWQKAADAIESLLDAGYELHGDYQNTFLTDNNEIIFARYFTPSSSVNFQWINGRSGSNGSDEGCPTQNLVNAYEMASTGLLPYSEAADGTLTLNPASGYDPNRPYDRRDPRFEATILHDGSMWQGRETETFHGGLDSPESSVGSWNASLTAYCFKKFIDEDVPVVGAAVNQTNPWIYFRYGEVLLNYAEAKFELGDESTAREYLNKVRARPGVNMPPVTDSGEALRKRIQNERRVELALEEHRFYDVRRWKIALETENKPLLAMNIQKQTDGSMTYEITVLTARSFGEQHYLLPIPRAEIDKSLGSLTQNPGY
jgi:hypothetical protein